MEERNSTVREEWMRRKPGGTEKIEEERERNKEKRKERVQMTETRLIEMV